jgi:hypothetical protein
MEGWRGGSYGCIGQASGNNRTPYGGEEMCREFCIMFRIEARKWGDAVYEKRVCFHEDIIFEKIVIVEFYVEFLFHEL